MIAIWLSKVHRALHNNDIENVVIKDAWRRITNRGKVRVMEVPAGSEVFTFLTQNPNTNSEWAAHARDGKKVTQVKKGAKYYGVIVGKDVFRYTKKGETPIWMGKL